MNADAPTIEIIDAKELAARLKLPTSWVYAYSPRTVPPSREHPARALWAALRQVRVALATA